MLNNRASWPTGSKNRKQGEFVEIDKNSRVPVYVQVMNMFIRQIEEGNLAEKEKLPTERELCQLYGISRSTVRQVFHELEKDGYVTIIKGRGAFVSQARLHQEMSGFYSFTQDMKKLGKTISTILIDFSQVPCDERISKKMKCKPGENILRFTRVRYADQDPMLIVKTHLLGTRFKNFDHRRLISESLYDMLGNTYNVVFSKGRETLQSVIARGDEASLLEIPPGAPCMKIDRYTYEKDSIIEYAVAIARGDKFQYNIDLR